MGTHTGNVITLANSIIGVSVLAMPYCFKQCGIILSILMLLFSNIITRLACHYLMKSAIMEKRKNFEMLAFRAFGPTGKLLVELCIIGFMLGTCIAYFVIMGDLGPAILGPILGYEHPTALRPSVLIAIAIFVVLPLGLLKNVDSLSGVCVATMAFYFCLVLKVLGEAIDHLINADWSDKVYYWRPSGILQCIPIFSMALSGQTQLFEIFDSLPSTPIDRMNSVVRSAVNMVTSFYISVGIFGYIAYCDQSFTGNLMMNFSKTMTSDVIKIGFLMSVAVSFPLVIFPCRASIHSLLFSKGYEHVQTGSAHISESRFQCITLLIVTMSLVIGLLIPNIEVVLGLVGSTIGVIISVIIPAVLFISLSSRNNNERLLAKMLVLIGLVIMVLGTYANLYASEEAISKPDLKPAPKIIHPPPKAVLDKVNIKDDTLKNLKNVDELAAVVPKLKPITKFEAVKPDIPKEFVKKEEVINIEKVLDIKREPPVPEEPIPVKKELKTLILDPVLKNRLPEVSLPKEDTVPKIEVPSNVNSVHVIDAAPVIMNPQKDKVSIKENNVKNNEKASPLILDSKKNEEVAQQIVVENKKDNEMKKEILIEKIKEHQEAQEKLIAEGEELLNKLKMVVATNISKDLGSETKVDVKPSSKDAVREVKKEEIKKSEAVKPENMAKEDPLVVSMAKGLPLPLAVKEQMAVNERKDAKPEKVVVEKVGREILGGSVDIKELREKRDLDEVLAVSPQNELGIKDSTLFMNKRLVVGEGKGASGSEQGYKPADVKIDDGTCVKNGSSAKLEVKKEEKESAGDTPLNSTLIEPPRGVSDDQLIKFSSHLSDLKPLLDSSPKLLETKGDSVVAEMPKKRDLKSIPSDDLTESNHRDA